MSKEYKHEWDVAVAAIRVAARICRSVQSRITPDVLQKQDRSPVTVADYCSQAVICQRIASVFPQDPIVGEEGSSDLQLPENSAFLERIVEELRAESIEASHDDICQWIDKGGSSEYTDRFWTLDPVDGTKGFLRGEQYAISLALIERGQIRMSVLGCPNLTVSSGSTGQKGEMFYARRGGGSWVANQYGPMKVKKVHVTSVNDVRHARLCESVESAHSSHGKSAELADQLGITKPSIRLDSQAKYGVVARGEADIYLRLPTRADYNEKIWDHAGGVLVVEEAGGRVTDIYGNNLQFTHGRELSANRGVVVSNGTMHETVLAALREIGVE